MISRISHAVLLLVLSLSSAASQVPSIDAFAPAAGTPGTHVTISGKNFGATPPENVVLFGAVRAPVDACTDTSCDVRVPVGATYGRISVTAHGLTAVSRAPFSVASTVAAALDSMLFPIKFSFGVWAPLYMQVADFDGDGKPDVAVSNWYDHVTLMRNTSTPLAISFGDPVYLESPTGPYGVTAGDLNGDGRPDLVVMQYNDFSTDSNIISIFRNTSSPGAISFAPRVTIVTGRWPVTAAIGDLDGDGRPDIVVANQSSNTLSVLRNTTAGDSLTFGPRLDLTMSLYLEDVVILDVDGDGKPDIVSTNYYDPVVSITRNTSTPGSLAFLPPVTVPTASGPSSLDVGDFNLDGLPDLLVVDDGCDSITVLGNTSTAGNPSFGFRHDYACGSVPFVPGIGDLDGDARPDIGVPNWNGSDNTISLYHNSGAGSGIAFSPHIRFDVGSNPNAVRFADIDGDGATDILVINYSSSSLMIFHNAGTAFAALAATYDFGEVTVGSSPYGTLGVANRGDVPLNFSSVFADDPVFGIAPATLQLLPHETHTFVIHYTASATGAKHAHFVFVHDGVSSPDTVDVSGTGVLSTTSTMRSGWNLVSVPFIASMKTTSALFPSANSAAYAYEGGYVPRDTLEHGSGYWVRFPAAQSQSVSGQPLGADTISVVPGWNLMGTLSAPIGAGNLATLATQIESPPYGFDGGYYATDSLMPGRAYWIKVSGAGTIMMSSAAPIYRHGAAASPGRQSSIVFEDASGERRTLHLVTGIGALGADAQFALPPPPPAGIFDVRFSTQTSHAVLDPDAPQLHTVQISSPVYPVTISWELLPEHRQSHLKAGKRDVVLGEAGKIEVLKEEDPVSIYGISAVRPSAFALDQNYPNPFNPQTTIAYSVPDAARVNISVFDVLGGRVATLVDRRQEAGTYSVVFEAGNLPSGVYFCTMRAGAFEGVRKMLIAR